MLRLNPDAKFTVSPPQAIEIFEARIEAGQELLEQEPYPDEESFRPWKADVDRWQSENDGVIDEIVLDPPPRTSGAPSSSFKPAPSFEQRIEWLVDEINDDITKMSRALTRLRIRAAAGSGQPEVLASAPTAAGHTEKEVTSQEPASDKEAESVRLGRDHPTVIHDESAPEADSAPEATPVNTLTSRKDDEDDRHGSNEQQPSPEVSTTDTSLMATPVLIAPAASAPLAGYDADAVTQRDFIGVEDVVDAFSYLIAARTVDPPLAVGLFGRWGSGKTFVMRAIQRRVNNITRGARESRRPQGEIGVYKRVVQIEFNAWHYVEGNLWASLVDHIFANLRTSADEGGSELERRRTEVSRNLASTREQRDTLDARLASLKQLQKDKEKELTDLEKRQRDRVKDVQRLRLGDIAAAAALSENDKSIVSEALKPLGVTELQESAADASQSLADARDVVSRGQALLAPMRQYGWKWAALLVVAVCLAPLIAFGLEKLNVSGVTQAVTAAAGVLSVVALLVRRGVSWTTLALNRIETAEQRVRQRVQRAVSDQAQQIAELQQQIESLQREQRSAASERDEAVAQIRTLAERLEELTPGRLLAQFLEERSDSADYRQHLGLTAIVRRDFEQLSRLVADYNVTIASDSTRNKSEGAADFNRVVLYVDDLDRCPPRRVVEVLQAVHLLLSFPIFVVVVAVDPRWLSQSLQSEYRNLLGGVAQRPENQASAQDYLEKIFQIPFSLAPLDLDARNRFVEELLVGEHVPPADHQLTSTPDVTVIDGLVSAPSSENARSSTEVEQLVPDAIPTAQPGTQAGNEDKSNKEPVENATAQSELHEEERIVIDDSVNGETSTIEHEPNDAALDSVDLAPSRLRLTAAESEYFDVIMPVLDTSPRGLKRYVNIYRLIKSISRIDGQALGEPGLPTAHQAAMTLLAMQSGLPVLGPGLVTAVAMADAPKSDPEVTLGGLIQTWIQTRTTEADDETSRITAWLDANPGIAAWRAEALSPTARHVRVYAFG